MPQAANCPPSINKSLCNVKCSLCPLGASRTSPPTDGGLTLSLSIAKMQLVQAACQKPAQIPLAPPRSFATLEDDRRGIRAFASLRMTRAGFRGLSRTSAPTEQARARDRVRGQSRTPVPTEHIRMRAKIRGLFAACGMMPVPTADASDGIPSVIQLMKI